MSDAGQDVIRSGRELVLRLLEDLKERARRTGVPIEDYKSREVECLDFVVADLLRSSKNRVEFAAEIVHELVWVQCLENANHRTALAFLAEFLSFLDVRFPSGWGDAAAMARFEAAANEWILATRPTVRARAASAAEKHLQETQAWLAMEIDAQSASLARISSNSLRSWLERAPPSGL